MSHTAISFTIWSILLVLLQGMILNNICLFGVAVPFLIVYIILRYPVTMPRAWLLTISFAMGLLIDILGNTQGLNALSCTVLAFARQPILHLYVPRQEELVSPIPSSRSMDMAAYAKYAATGTILFCTVLFGAEFFTFWHWGQMLARIICSSILTCVLIVTVDSLVSRINS